MGNIFNPDFRDFLEALNLHDVRYSLVGGYAVILHGYARTTSEMDIWIDNTEENYVHLTSAFQSFGMPVFDMTLENFLASEKFEVFRFGRKPVAIDVMIKMADFNFSDCYNRAEIFEDHGLNIPVVHIQDLIAAKKIAGRAKDLYDIQHL
ncbi:MAG TPA: hypothetical protein VFG10_07345 [Saprospiraceae bacterium]|nr:hypothetical protein [Saprospiraceae bacterium]